MRLIHSTFPWIIHPSIFYRLSCTQGWAAGGGLEVIPVTMGQRLPWTSCRFIAGLWLDSWTFTLFCRRVHAAEKSDSIIFLIEFEFSRLWACEHRNASSNQICPWYAKLAYLTAYGKVSTISWTTCSVFLDRPTVDLKSSCKHHEPVVSVPKTFAMNTENFDIFFFFTLNYQWTLTVPVRTFHINSFFFLRFCHKFMSVWRVLIRTFLIFLRF